MGDGVAVFTIDSTYRLAYMAFLLSILQPPDQLSLLGDMLDWMLP